MITRSALLLILLFASSALAATFTAQGTNLTVTSGTLQVSFSGGDVTGIKNLLTSEIYMRNPSTNMQLNLNLVQAATTGLPAVGAWTVNGSVASLSFSDSNRTVSVNITVDPATQEIVVNLTGTAQHGGVETLVWGITGFDMNAGKFVVPAWGGMQLNSTSLQAQGTYYFNGDAWDAPFALFQSGAGGVNIYSKDTHALCRDLWISTNQQQTTNALFQVEGPAPWNTATQAGRVLPMAPMAAPFAAPLALGRELCWVWVGVGAGVVCAGGACASAAGTTAPHRSAMRFECGHSYHW